MPGEDRALLAALRDARRHQGARYRAPDEVELRGYDTWVSSVAKHAWTDLLPVATPPSGFTGRLGANGALWLLQEASTHQRGAGLVVLRPSHGERVLVEAPHTFFDEGTLEISLQAFHGLGARALLINTMHRYGSLPPELRSDAAARKGSVSDVAHASTSFFTVAHRALNSTEPCLTLQIHGFADSTAPGVLAVVSAAQTQANASALAHSLREALDDDRIRTYPEEIDVLGGTTNAQAKVSRELKAPFIHLELSRTLRDTLLDDPELAARFILALRVLVEDSP